MDAVQTLILGLIAGVTIVLGLPLGRLRSARHSRTAPAVRVFLNAFAIGILIFIMWDLLNQAWEMIGATLDKVHDGSGSVAPVIGFGALLFAGLGVGLLSLAGYERWLAGEGPIPLLGPGTMAADELTLRRGDTWTAARRLAFLIAVGIGLHNFGEGLAIGGSAAQGKIALATLLVTGFALHNATEGFGIVAPLATEQEQPSWGFLLLLGVIGGGPTVLGTVIGHQFTSDPMSLVFLTLAAGSILYVIIQLVAIALRGGHRSLLYWGVWVGLVAGFATDMLLTAGGA
ncbi:MAG TPA: ZIP family metal transporter [Pseudonocardiaceae bacterium]|nr:ZIP family metal transporter [Pseudonocardiaceae bacterium]